MSDVKSHTDLLHAIQQINSGAEISNFFPTSFVVNGEIATFIDVQFADGSHSGQSVFIHDKGSHSVADAHSDNSFSLVYAIGEGDIRIEVHPDDSSYVSGWLGGRGVPGPAFSARDVQHMGSKFGTTGYVSMLKHAAENHPIFKDELRGAELGRQIGEANIARIAILDLDEDSPSRTVADARRPERKKNVIG